ncbi:UNVERIFIED_CONTAM: hypothetical protein DES50_10547 [Williamsia faeni]
MDVAEYALWKSTKHYLQKADPAVMSDSIGELEAYARSRSWAAPAIVAVARAGDWIPIYKVYANRTTPQTDKQGETYRAFRASTGRMWPKHLGAPLSDLSQD